MTPPAHGSLLLMGVSLGAVTVSSSASHRSVDSDGEVGAVGCCDDLRTNDTCRTQHGLYCCCCCCCLLLPAAHRNACSCVLRLLSCMINRLAPARGCFQHTKYILYFGKRLRGGKAPNFIEESKKAGKQEEPKSDAQDVIGDIAKPVCVGHSYSRGVYLNLPSSLHHRTPNKGFDSNCVVSMVRGSKTAASRGESASSRSSSR